VATDDATTRLGACVGIPVWQRMGLGVLAGYIPAGLVDQVLADTGRVQQRVRWLPARAVVWFVLALTLFGGHGYRSVWRELAHSGSDEGPTPSTSGLSQARRRLGVAPLAALFARLRGPQAQSDAPGAFLSGLRLVSWDATMLDVPDSPANAKAFIASRNKRGRGAFCEGPAVHAHRVRHPRRYRRGLRRRLRTGPRAPATAGVDTGNAAVG